MARRSGPRRRLFSAVIATRRPGYRTSVDCEAGVLLELLKDLLYQAYVRKGKLQQAMMVRRFFAEETLDKITPIGRAAPNK